MKKLLILISLLACINCSASHPVVKTGVEVLRDRDFEGLVGKRVGLVTNPSGVDSRLKSTIDILNEAPGVELVALYGPEHGVRGEVYAGGKVDSFTTYCVNCGTEGVSPPTPSIHRLQRGLPGYLILFDPHAFVPQRQLRIREMPSQSVFCVISMHFTATPHIPPTASAF